MSKRHPSPPLEDVTLNDVTLSDIPIHAPRDEKRDETHPPIRPISPSRVHDLQHEQNNDGHESSSGNSTATNSSDEFNWDEEDGNTDGPKSKDHVKARRLRALYLLFMKLSSFIRTFIVGVLGCGILIAPLLVVTFRFKDSPAHPHVWLWSLWLTIVWAAGCITYLLVDILPRVIVFFVSVAGTKVERIKTQIELTTAVSGWLKLALDISWAWIALSALRTVYKPPGQYWTIVNRVMQALFAAGILILVEKLFLQFVAINFHEKALAERLGENRLGLKALDRLSNAQPAPARRNVYRKTGHKSMASSLDWTHKGVEDKEKDTPSLKNAERQRKRKKAIANVIVDQVSGAIGQVALKDSKFNRHGLMGGLDSARKLARKLFGALDKGRSHLVVEDFYPYFKTTADAHAAFAVFDKDGNGDISKREMREAVQRIYRERKALNASLKDVSAVVGKLDAVLLSLTLVVIIFICLLIFNRANTLASLVPLATLVLGFSFVFGHSAQTLFESLIFIFSTHVFDVGDLVLIDDQVLFVKEFGLFSTTFTRVDGQEIIAPNSLLANTKLIHNIRRSNSMWETTSITVSYDTPLEVLEMLKSKVSAYIATNHREWSSCSLNIDRMEYQNALYLNIGIEHRPNWQDWGGRWARRTVFMRNLKEILEELDLRYTLPTQPILMPSSSPYGAVHSPSSPGFGSHLGVSRESLGNAGFFAPPGDSLRAPARSLGSTGGGFS